MSFMWEYLLIYHPHFSVLGWRGSSQEAKEQGNIMGSVQIKARRPA